MALFYVERQPWQRWPKKLVVVRKVDGSGKDERRAYVPERTCRNLNSVTCRNFICSECGDSYEKGLNLPNPNFCLNCGSRVTEADHAQA